MAGKIGRYGISLALMVLFLLAVSTANADISGVWYVEDVGFYILKSKKCRVKIWGEYYIENLIAFYPDRTFEDFWGFIGWWKQRKNRFKARYDMSIWEELAEEVLEDVFPGCYVDVFIKKHRFKGKQLGELMVKTKVRAKGKAFVYCPEGTCRFKLKVKGTFITAEREIYAESGEIPEIEKAPNPTEEVRKQLKEMNLRPGESLDQPLRIELKMPD